MVSRRTALVALTAALILLPLRTTVAATAAELRQQIQDHTDKIDQLNTEIAQYEKQLAETSSQKNTLQSAVQTLDLSVKKVNASIQAEQQKIQRTELQLSQLGDSIDSAQSSIDTDQEAVKEVMRQLNEADTQSLIVQMLSGESLGQVWDAIGASEQVQASLSTHVKELQQSKRNLQDAQTATDAKRKELLSEQQALVAQRESLRVTQQQKAKLLAETKDKESNYQQILAQKKAEEAAFENELNDLQSQLKYTLDPSSFPVAGQSVLSWPLDHIRITQYFGNTEFAKGGAYNGKGHNGVDFAAVIGTPVHAALTATVTDTGDTDKGACYSYGKWILLRHPNGLSSLYAHLSSINVSKGQQVSTGEVIGYSGFTGYATGPHLHFGVFVSNAVKVMDLGAWYRAEGRTPTTPCAKAGVSIPVAPLNGYLNPMDYLPKLK